MNDEATCYVGNIPREATDEIIEELFTQVGPIKSFTMKKNETHTYALVEFEDEDSVSFAIEVLDGVALFGKGISVKPRNNTKQEEAWLKMLAGRKTNERNDSNSRNSQPYLPQLESRKRDHGGHIQDFSRSMPPPPPPPTMPLMSSYITPPPQPPVLGYTRSSGRHDRWHTPPSVDQLNPRIPPEYDTPHRAYDKRYEQSSNGRYQGSRSDHRDNRKASGDYRDGRSDHRSGYQDRRNDRRY